MDIGFIQRQATFILLREVCGDVLSIVPKTHADNLQLEQKLRHLIDVLKQQPPDALTYCFDVVALPLRTVLKFFSLPYIGDSVGYPQPGSERVREALLEALAVLAHRATNISRSQFSDILQVLLNVLNLESGTTKEDKLIANAANKPQPFGTMRLSDDTKMFTIQCFTGIFTKYTVEAGEVDLLQKSEMLPSIGYLIYRLLEMAVTERNRELQSQALSGLQVVIDRIGSPDVVANFVPGILTSLCRILTGDYKQGHKVFTNAFDLLSRIIVLIFSDSINPALPKSDTHMTAADAIAALSSLSTGAKPTNKKQPPVVQPPPVQKDNNGTTRFVPAVRNAAWYEMAVPIVHKALSRIFAVATRGTDGEMAAPFSPSSIILDNWTVRYALVKCAASISEHCFRTLWSTVAALLEVLVMHAFDDYTEIAQLSQSALSKFSAAFAGDQSKFSGSALDISKNESLQNLLVENLNQLVTSLPRIFREVDEKKKLLRLRLLVGYLRLLKNMLPVIVTANVERIALTLFQLLEFDVHNIRMTKRKNVYLIDSGENRNPELGEGDPNLSSQFSFQFVRKQFRFIKDDRVLDLLVMAIRLLGQYGEEMALVDYLISVLRSETSDYKQQAIFILNELLIGVSGIALTEEEAKAERASERSRKRARKERVSKLVDFLLEEYLSPNVWDYYNIEILNAHAVLAALFLEGIGHFAQILGEKFNTKLMHVLYPVITKLGEESELVSLAAWATLLRIAYFCGYQSVHDLVKQNTDYIVDSLITQMRYFRNYATSLRVLNGLLKHTGQAMVPLLKDIIDEVFRGLDTREGHWTMAFLQVVHGVVVIMKDTTHKLRKSVSLPQPAKTESTDVESIRSIAYGKDVDISAFFTAKIERRRARLAEELEEKNETAEEFFTRYHAEKEAKKEEEPEPEDISTGKVEDEEELEAKKNDPYYTIKKEYALHFDMAVAILEKCRHYTAIKHLESRLLVLDIVANAVEALSLDTKKLLPAVHDIWDPLRHRFVDRDHRVLVKALHVMKVMATWCEDFLVRKFHEDLWPLVKQGISLYNIFTEEGRRFINRNVTSINTQYSKFSQASAVFKQSASFITQKSALQCLAETAGFVPLMKQDVHDIAITCWFYLSDTQPTEFQLLAVKIFQQLIKLDGDFVWFLLRELDVRTNTALAQQATLLLDTQHKNRHDILTHLQGNVSTLLDMCNL